LWVFGHPDLVPALVADLLPDLVPDVVPDLVPDLVLTRSQLAIALQPRMFAKIGVNCFMFLALVRALLPRRLAAIAYVTGWQLYP